MPAAAPMEHAAPALGQQPARIPRGRLAAPRVRPIISDSDESDNERRNDGLTRKERDCKLRKINSTVSNRKKPQNRYSDVDETSGTSSGFKAAASSMRNHAGHEKAVRNISWPRSSSSSTSVGPLDDEEDVPNWSEAAFDFSKDHGGADFNEDKLSGIYVPENADVMYESMDSEEDRSLYSHPIRSQIGIELPQSFKSTAYSSSRSHASDSSLEDVFDGNDNETAKRLLSSKRGEGFSSINESSSSSTARFPYPIKSARPSASGEHEKDLLKNPELHDRYRGSGIEPENSFRKHHRNNQGYEMNNFSSRNRYNADKNVGSAGLGGSKANKIESKTFEPKTNFNFRFEPIDEANMSGEDSVLPPITDTSIPLAGGDNAFEEEGINMENIPKNILLNDNEWSSEEEVGEAAEGDLREEMIDIFEDNDFMDVINARGEHLADLEIHIALDEVLGIRPNRPWYGQLIDTPYYSRDPLLWH